MIRECFPLWSLQKWDVHRREVHIIIIIGQLISVPVQCKGYSFNEDVAFNQDTQLLREIFNC